VNNEVAAFSAALSTYEMKWNVADVLGILDHCCDVFTFPMLDNGYFYLAAARLSLHRSDDDWAIVIETFGYSPREGSPSTYIQTFASRFSRRKGPADYVSREAYENYLLQNPHNEFDGAYPFDNDDWMDSDNPELVSEATVAVAIRGVSCLVPRPTEYTSFGIKLEDPMRIQVYEFCRAMASLRRDDVLATREERCAHLLPDMRQLLVLEEWHHPDVVRETERPGTSETFRQLALVLITGDVAQYRPTLEPNTHWMNWPEGGTL